MDSDSTLVSFDYAITVYKATLPILVERQKLELGQVMTQGDLSWAVGPLLKQWLEMLSNDVSLKVTCQIHWNSLTPHITDNADGSLECLYGVTLFGTLAQIYVARAALLKRKPSQVRFSAHPAVLESF